MFVHGAGVFMLAVAASVATQSATIIVEASHGGAGNGLTNTSITVPLGATYTSTVLDTVSTLYLTGASGVPVDSITCAPYKYANGTGAGGLAFNNTTPSRLSTNTVQVGSLKCTTPFAVIISSTPASASLTSVAFGNSTSSSALVSTITNPTSTFLTTIPALGTTPAQSTVTNMVTASDSSSTAAPVASTTTSVSSPSATLFASPSLGSSDASHALFGSGLLQGLVLAGVGLSALG